MIQPASQDAVGVNVPDGSLGRAERSHPVADVAVLVGVLDRRTPRADAMGARIVGHRDRLARVAGIEVGVREARQLGEDTDDEYHHRGKRKRS